MQELVRLVVNRTGLSYEHATVVVKTTLELIKQKLPSSLALQVESLMRDSDPSTDPRIFIGNTFEEK